MSKFFCLVLCVVAASLSYIHVGEALETLRDSLGPIIEECAKVHKVTLADIKTATETGNPSLVPPCLSGCVFKKAGFIDSQGQYDMDTGLINLRKVIHEEDQYNNLEAVAKDCASVNHQDVSDGVAGCERGALLSACFLKHKTNILL